MSEAAIIEAIEAELPPLTKVEDNFALAVIETNGNIDAASRLLFKETYTGRELLSRPQVVNRIRALTEKIDDAALASKGSHLIELAVIRDLAKDSGQLKVALGAERARGEVIGLYDGKTPGGKGGGPLVAVQVNMVSAHDARI